MIVLFRTKLLFNTVKNLYVTQFGGSYVTLFENTDSSYNISVCLMDIFVKTLYVQRSFETTIKPHLSENRSSGSTF